MYFVGFLVLVEASSFTDAFLLEGFFLVEVAFFFVAVGFFATSTSLGSTLYSKSLVFASSFVSEQESQQDLH